MAKGRKRNVNGSPGVGHNSNVSDEAYKRWLSKIETADAAYVRARDIATKRKGELGQIYEAAEEDGCNITAIKEARKKHKLEHTQVAADYVEMGRVLRLMQSPLAVQLSLFTPPDWPEEVRAGLDGKLAGKNGEPIDNCPFKPGSMAFVAWRDNWEAGQAELRKGLRGKQAEAS